MLIFMHFLMEKAKQGTLAMLNTCRIINRFSLLFDRHYLPAD